MDAALEGKKPSRACPPVEPDEHGLVEADNPQNNKYSNHVQIPCCNHITNLPKTINKRRWFLVCEPAISCDYSKAITCHAPQKVVWTWLLSFIE